MKMLFVLGMIALVHAGFGAQALVKTNLNYAVTKSGNAVSTELVSVGVRDDGQAKVALRLTYTAQSWSRFNWPHFAPDPALTSVRLIVRAEGTEPLTFLARVVTVDGVEWQTKPLRASDAWQTFELKTTDFSWFRGGDSRAATLQFSQVTEFNLAITAREKTAAEKKALLVDDICFLPQGPNFLHEGSEIATVSTDPVQMSFERLNDLRTRWSVEWAKLDHATKQEKSGIAALQKARTLAQKNETSDAARYCADAASVLHCPAHVEDVGTAHWPVLSFSEYTEKLARFASVTSMPFVVINPAKKGALQTGVMYQSCKQARAEIVQQKDVFHVRQRIVFTREDAKQVVNISCPVDGASRGISMRDRMIHVPMRCTAKGLNEKMPLLLRLYSHAPDGSESWAQFAPEVMPTNAWTPCAFDLSKPQQNVRFDPSHVVSIALRVENIPGQADDFYVDMGTLSLGWAPAPARLITEEMAHIEGAILNARLALLELRQQRLACEMALRPYAALYSAYRARFQMPHVQGPATCNTAVIPASVTHEFNSAAVRYRVLRKGAQAYLRVEYPAGTATHLAVELRDAQGRCVIAEHQQGASLELPLNAVGFWRPGAPNLFELVIYATRNETVLATVKRPFGVRTSELVFGAPNTSLRHAVKPGLLDWAWQWNGRSDFGHYACYNCDDPVRPIVQTQRLFGDLWVDGARYYGFSLNPQNIRFHDACGISQLAGVAGNYAQLSDWSDLAQLSAAYTNKVSLLGSWNEHASVGILQVGNEVELNMWGADLNTAFPCAPYQPIDCVAQQLRAQQVSTAPIMYVRPGNFTTIPPLPHEDVCGVNQYTGRYHGRMEEIERDLAELGAYAILANRPWMITEWNGPKYSWATSGIGGVTPRGAAYYLERYWRGLLNSPGVVGSSEFTLNWIIAPFEDLTTQSREDAYRSRPKHHRFGGGYTADHVPLVSPEDAVTNDACYRITRAFHGPLYTLMNRPGEVDILFCKTTRKHALHIAELLETLGKTCRCVDVSEARYAPRSAHVIALLDQGCETLKAWYAAGVLEPIRETISEPNVQVVLNPASMEHLIVGMTAHTGDALQRGGERIEKSAYELMRLRWAESCMGRVVALTDPARVRVYENYLFEQAARGYLMVGDDTRTNLHAQAFFDAAGTRLPEWSQWQALVLDCSRRLTPDEMAVIQHAAQDGVHIVISRNCYANNPELQRWCPAALTEVGTLMDPCPVAPVMAAPIPVADLGSVSRDVVNAFAPKLIADQALKIFSVHPEGDAEVLARTAQQKPVVVAWKRGCARVTLFGVDFGAAAGVHWSITHAGKSHPIYDRDTACGLERLSRGVINSCLRDSDIWLKDFEGMPKHALLPRLFVRLTPQSHLVHGGVRACGTVDVALCDSEGRAVTNGVIFGRARLSVDGRAIGKGEFSRLTLGSQGTCMATLAPAGTSASFTYTPAKQLGTRCSVISLQVKAYAKGYVPVDDAVAMVVAE